MISAINNQELEQLKNYIETIWQEKEQIKNIPDKKFEALEIVKQVIALSDKGIIRAADKINNKWQTNIWFKQAILLLFMLSDMELINAGSSTNNQQINYWYDKIRLKFHNWTKEKFVEHNFRVVSGSIVRQGAYIGKNAIIMPSFVNTGSYIDDDTMIDSGVTVGCCAQIGKKCHISSNVVIGGVLEPLQNNPVIVEDNCFIGVGSSITEGVIVEEGTVISTNVAISNSTKIIDRDSGQIFYGKVPAYSVVVGGSIAHDKYPKVAVQAAIIVKQVDAVTRSKTSINELLRNYD